MFLKGNQIQYMYTYYAHNCVPTVIVLDIKGFQNNSECSVIIINNRQYVACKDLLSDRS